jgi:hypothetical protein
MRAKCQVIQSRRVPVAYENFGGARTYAMGLPQPTVNYLTDSVISIIFRVASPASSPQPQPPELFHTYENERI